MYIPIFVLQRTGEIVYSKASVLEYAFCVNHTNFNFCVETKNQKYFVTLDVSVLCMPQKTSNILRNFEEKIWIFVREWAFANAKCIRRSDKFFFET